MPLDSNENGWLGLKTFPAVTSTVARAALSDSSASISGTPGDDSFVLTVNGTTLQLFQNTDPAGTPTCIGSLAGISASSINAGNGNDSLTIASSLPFTPTFGGGVGQKTLIINAGSYAFGSDLSLGADNLNFAVGGDVTVTFNSSQRFAISHGSSEGSTAGGYVQNGRYFRSMGHGPCQQTSADSYMSIRWKE